MNLRKTSNGVWKHPLGRILAIFVGVCFLYGALTVYPPIRPVIWWSIPVVLIIWGLSRLYLYGVGDFLTLIAGSLLILGGLTRGLFQLAPMNEFIGAVANGITFAGIVAEIFAQHYRESQ